MVSLLLSALLGVGGCSCGATSLSVEGMPEQARIHYEGFLVVRLLIASRYAGVDATWAR